MVDSSIESPISLIASRSLSSENSPCRRSMFQSAKHSAAKLHVTRDCILSPRSTLHKVCCPSSTRGAKVSKCTLRSSIPIWDLIHLPSFSSFEGTCEITYETMTCGESQSCDIHKARYLLIYSQLTVGVVSTYIHLYLSGLPSSSCPVRSAQYMPLHVPLVHLPPVSLGQHGSRYLTEPSNIAACDQTWKLSLGRLDILLSRLQSIRKARLHDTL